MDWARPCRLEDRGLRLSWCVRWCGFAAALFLASVDRVSAAVLAAHKQKTVQRRPARHAQSPRPRPEQDQKLRDKELEKMQVHAVPDSERAYDSTGRKLPWAYEFAE